MRCYLHALLLCMVFAFLSLLYVFNQLASTLEEPGEWTVRKAHRTADRNSHDTGHAVRKAPGVAGHDRERSGTTFKENRDERIHLAVVACGPRLEETVNMLKSAVLFSKKPLHFHIFAEDHLHDSFRSALDSWPSLVQARFNFTTYPITFPSENANEWKKLFKPCASQRLFLPVGLGSSSMHMTILDDKYDKCAHKVYAVSDFQLILKNVDSLLYVDTDILFLQPVDEIWGFLSQFNSSHLAAMAPEHEEPRIAWYNRFARHPYYGKTGINSGVMLMNMTRIREKYFKNDMTVVPLRWEEMLMPLLQKYKLNITWGDQDLLNIIFHHNPESLYVFPCQWNYRPDHCIYGSNCKQAEQEGVFILHGNRGVYHDDKQPAFRAVYEAIQKHPFGENMVNSLLLPLETALQATTNTYCGRASHLFTKRLQQSIKDAAQRR
ncbi:glucoside xylosyltransferase 1 isoform X3 [Myripristis murdjan]|uniref:glucoside xylosyltransferase 1 isoform X3 n=1 Tax=Myripristis murdjan TaxID=586833 RepID=UPI001175D8FD|nr:glucoside xylosyltransferase 1-like isoform X3 [Myripristis murdjan]